MNWGDRVESESEVIVIWRKTKVDAESCIASRGNAGMLEIQFCREYIGEGTGVTNEWCPVGNIFIEVSSLFGCWFYVDRDMLMKKSLVYLFKSSEASKNSGFCSASWATVFTISFPSTFTYAGTHVKVTLVPETWWLVSEQSSVELPILRRHVLKSNSSKNCWLLGCIRRVAINSVMSTLEIVRLKSVYLYTYSYKLYFIYTILRIWLVCILI